MPLCTGVPPYTIKANQTLSPGRRIQSVHIYHWGFSRGYSFQGLPPGSAGGQWPFSEKQARWPCPQKSQCCEHPAGSGSGEGWLLGYFKGPGDEQRWPCVTSPGQQEWGPLCLPHDLTPSSQQTRTTRLCPCHEELRAEQP